MFLTFNAFISHINLTWLHNKGQHKSQWTSPLFTLSMALTFRFYPAVSDIHFSMFLCFNVLDVNQHSQSIIQVTRSSAIQLQFICLFAFDRSLQFQCTHYKISQHPRK